MYTYNFKTVFSVKLQPPIQKKGGAASRKVPIKRIMHQFNSSFLLGRALSCSSFVLHSLYGARSQMR